MMEVKTWKPMENCAACKQAEKLFQQHTRIAAQINARAIKRIRELEAEVARLESPFRKAELKAMEDLEGFRASSKHAQLIRRAKAAESKLRAVGELPGRWRWEVELMCTEIGHTVKHAVETRADELDALLEKE